MKLWLKCSRVNRNFKFVLLGIIEENNKEQDAEMHPVFFWFEDLNLKEWVYIEIWVCLKIRIDKSYIKQVTILYTQ